MAASEPRLRGSLATSSHPPPHIQRRAICLSRSSASRAISIAGIPLVILALALCGGLAAATAGTSLSLRSVAIVSLSAQIIIAGYIIRRSRLLSVCGIFAALWTVYFPLRLAEITFGGPQFYYFPAVNLVSGSELKTLWVSTAAGLIAFLLAGTHPTGLRVTCHLQMMYPLDIRSFSP